MWADIEKYHKQFHEYSLSASQLFSNGGNLQNIRDTETKMMQTSTWLMNSIIELDKLAESTMGEHIKP